MIFGLIFFVMKPKMEPLEMVLNSRAAADLVEQETVMRQVLNLYFFLKVTSVDCSVLYGILLISG